MKFEILCKNFNAAVQSVRRAIETRPDRPIFTCIAITSRDGVVSLTARNLTKGFALFERVAAETEGTLQIAVDGTRLGELADSYPQDSTLTVTLEEKSLILKCGRSKATLTTMPVDLFPAGSSFSDAPTIAIPAEELRLAIRQTIFAVNPAEAHAALTGLSIHLGNGCMRVIGCDRYRFARKTFIVENVEEKLDLIMPMHAAQQLQRLLEGQEKVWMSWTKSEASFVTEDSQVTSQLIHGKYMPVDEALNVIVKESTLCVSMSKAELKAAINSVLVVSDRDNHKICLAPTEDGYRLECESAKHGKSQADVAGNIQTEDIAPFEICLNAKYLLDTLGQVNEAEARLRMSARNKPLAVIEGDLTVGLLPICEG